MDPLLIVDYFAMTAPAFESHLHAGISAVTVMFANSKGAFLNRDTLGDNIKLRAGDLYWLAAASGAAHEEKPAQDSRIHALQVFVNLLKRLKRCPARSLQVNAGDIPTMEGDGYRVRVILGASGDVTGETGTPQEMTISRRLFGGQRRVQPRTAGRTAGMDLCRVGTVMVATAARQQGEGIALLAGRLAEQPAAA